MKGTGKGRLSRLPGESNTNHVLKGLQEKQFHPAVAAFVT